MSRTKNKRPSQEFSSAPVQPEPAHYTTKSGIRKAVRIIPRNLHQEAYLDYLLNPDKIIILAHGPAGSGKTQLAMLAAIKALSEKKVDKIILCRPAITVDEESHGFLPGDLRSKITPYLIPLIDVLLEYYSSKDLENMLETGIIEMAPLAFMRGRNLKRCFVVLDEAQNASSSQIKVLFTRICDGTKVVVTGDNNQSDKRNGENGLQNFKNMVETYGECKYIANIEFNHQDIERHPVVTEVLRILGDF